MLLGSVAVVMASFLVDASYGLLELSRCSVPCDGQTQLGTAPTSSLCAAAGLDKWTCTNFEAPNLCLPPCATDDDCPVLDLLTSPPGNKPWRHLTCNFKGYCDLPD